MFKYYHNLLPPLFDGFFSLNTDVHSYYTRMSKAFQMPAVRTALRKQSVIFTGPSIWNKIAVEYHQLSSVASFIFHYKKTHVAQY